MPSFWSDQLNTLSTSLQLDVSKTLVDQGFMIQDDLCWAQWSRWHVALQ